MARQKDAAGSEPTDLLHFVTHRVSELSGAFAASPLMQLRVSVAGSSITLVKSALTAEGAAQEPLTEPDRRHGSRSPHAILSEGEPGRQFDSVCSDVVGVFHSAPDLPAPGERIEPDRVLGDIEALKLRTPVRAGIAGRFVGQVVEDGQPVDFGEALFVIDSGPAPAAVEEPVPPPAEELEPPRI